MTAGVRSPWTVRRRWIPRLGQDTLWRRFRRRVHRVWERVRRNVDLGDAGCVDDLGEGIAAFLLVVLVLVILAFVVLPLAIAIVDVAILLLLALLSIPARIVFRRPWLIEARDGSGRVLRWRVVGERASRARVEEIRQLLEAGIVPPDAEESTDPDLDPSAGDGRPS